MSAADHVRHVFPVIEDGRERRAEARRARRPGLDDEENELEAADPEGWLGPCSEDDR